MKLVKKKRGHGPRTPRTPRLTAAQRAEQKAGIVKMSEEMGRRFALAFISYQSMTTYETARKNYGHEPAPTGSGWRVRSVPTSAAGACPTRSTRSIRLRASRAGRDGTQEQAMKEERE